MILAYPAEFSGFFQKNLPGVFYVGINCQKGRLFFLFAYLIEAQGVFGRGFIGQPTISVFTPAAAVAVNEMEGSGIGADDFIVVVTDVADGMAGAEIAAGFTLIGTMTPLGVLAGAILVTDGANSISKEVARYATNNTTSEGLVANAAMSTAEFMGFSRENGLGVYKSISLAANAYTIFGLLRRPGTWRLFRYLPTDYYRKVSTLSRPQLTMKIAGYGVKAKIIFDLLSVSDPSQN